MPASSSTLRVLMAAFALLTTIGCSSPSPTIEAGWQQLEQQDYQQALTHFDAAIAQDDRAELQAGRAQALYFLRQTAEAEQAYARAISLEPQECRWHTELAMMRMANGEWSAAIASFDQALEIDADQPRILFNRGYAYQRNGDSASAIADYTAAITLDSQFAEAYNSRGILLAQEGSLDAGLRDFRLAVQLNPYLANAYANIAAVNYSRGNAKLAFVELNTAIKIEGDNPLYYKNRGKIYLDFGNPKNALRDFERALNLSPEDESLRQLIAKTQGLGIKSS